MRVELRARGLLWREALRAGLLSLDETPSGPILLPRATGGVAITYYWVGGAGTWDNSATTHWSLTSGGSSGAGPPDADDIATFDSGSGLGSGGTVTVASTAVCGGCVIGGIASKTVIFSFSGNVTWNAGTYTFAGNDATTPIIFQSSAVGTTRTVTINGTHTSHSWLHFMDITIAGTAGTLTGTLIGDCGGNSGITFDASSTQTATGTASFTWSTHAFTGTGATHNPPLPQDDVVISNAFVAGRTITADMPRLGRSVDASACTGTPTLSASVNVTVFGSLLVAASMTLSGNLILGGRSSYSLGAQGSGMPLTVNAPGGTYTLTSSYVTSGSLTHNLGALATAGFAAQFSSADVRGSGTHSLTLSTSTLTLTSTGTIWNAASATAFTLSAASSTIVISNTTNTAKTFAGGSLAYGTLQHTATGSAALTITGSNTFAALDLECTTARTVTLPASGTQTITGTVTLAGASGQNLSLVSSSPGTSTTLSGLAASWSINGFVTRSADILTLGASPSASASPSSSVSLSPSASISASSSASVSASISLSLSASISLSDSSSVSPSPSAAADMGYYLRNRRSG